MTDDRREELVELLKLAQNGNVIAETALLTHIRDNEIKRIGRYLRKNRVVEDDDIIQEFMIGVSMSINKAKLDVGCPIEYILSMGVYRARAYMRKYIIKATSQICLDCGYESRLYKVNNDYVCKKCGSTKIETRELLEHDEITIGNKATDNDDIDELIENMTSKSIIEKFRSTLDQNTKVYSLFVLLYDKDINNGNDAITNYISEIAKRWNTSQTLVIQIKDKLRMRLIKFCKEEGLEVKDGKFFYK